MTTQNISVIFMTQDLFQKKCKVDRNNSHYIVLMRAPNAALQIRKLGVQLFHTQFEYFMEEYRLATANKYGYLVIDLSFTAKPIMMLRTNIFKEADENICNNIPFLKTLFRSKSERKRSRILRADTNQELLAIEESALNIVRGRFGSSARQKSRIDP